MHLPIPLLDDNAQHRMRHAGRVAARTLRFVGQRIRPGMTTGAIDRLVRQDTARRKGTPSQLGYEGFPAAVCTSRNHVVCHGIPSDNEHLMRGDIVNIDVTTNLGGFHGDTSRTFFIGTPSAEAQHIVQVAERCLHAGIAAVSVGGHMGDIGHAIQTLAEREGCSVVTLFGGHGIGARMHLPPHVHHTGTPGTGPRIRPGMAFTIEPMVNLGSPDVIILDDGWTVVTADGRLSAQFEHTLMVTDTDVEVLTRL